MIFVTDKGRLCNNILQYGHVYAWAREQGLKTVSMRFAHMYPEFHLSHTHNHHPWVYLLVKLAAKRGWIPTVEFNDFTSEYTVEKKIMLHCRFVLAKGWCIRFFDLFEKYKDEIIAMFEFRKPVKKKVNTLLSAYSPDTIKLGVHIRRGDYATWCGGHYFYNDEQYAASIEKFIQLMAGRNVDIFICGNDPKLNHDFYIKRFGADHVHFPNGSPAEDLCLFSQCDYLIGPPSTFTLVATMYRDTPLHWITDPNASLTLDDFGKFNQMSRTFDGLYISN